MGWMLRGDENRQVLDPQGLFGLLRVIGLAVISMARASVLAFERWWTKP